MRWWLALAFAGVAALTALAVAELFTNRAEDAFRTRARELAVGNSVSAATMVSRTEPGDLESVAASISQQRRLAVFVLDTTGETLAAATRGASFDRQPLLRQAGQIALTGQRFVEATNDGQTIVVGLPLRTRAGARVVLAGAIVTLTSRPELVDELAIVRDEIVPAALVAALVGAGAGMVIAVLIALRLRRIAAAAAAIESGNFEIELQQGFHDEVGALATTVDRMRLRLRASFAELEAERDRLRLLLERLHEGVIALDQALHVQLANGVADRMTGQQLQAGDSLPDAWPDFSLRAFAETLFAPEARLTEARFSPDPDTTYTVVGIPSVPVSRIGVLVLTDISERERRERAEREFVANAAHELRTPLTAITGAVEALSLGAKDVPRDRDRFLGVIERQVGRLNRLARALLVLARAQTRQEALKLEPVELRPLLEHVLAGLALEDAAVELACPLGLSALAQRDLVEQVVSNLVTNAVKHSGDGTISLSVRATNDSVTLEVTDTGSGIDPADQARIFDRFYSADRDSGESFGLGLAIVREAVRALGGVVAVESVPRTGTAVRVTLARVAGERA
jgi:signal transduction histidine kinase/HAMP domain-containing protein